MTLFQILKENLETGLRGYPVGYCTSSYVDPEKGLYYRDYPIEELAFLDPIEVIYLLWKGERAEKQELVDFQKELEKRAFLSDEIVHAIYALPQKGSPIDHFAASLQILGMLEEKKDYKEDALSLIAKLPLLAANVMNAYQGWGKTPSSDFSLGYMENFTKLLNIPGLPDQKLLTKVFRLFNVLHYDHGGGNLSVFVAKAVASGLQHLCGSVASGINALAGSRHGRANESCFYFVRSLYENMPGSLEEETLYQIVQEKVLEQKLIYGFGHAVLRAEDPRARIFYQFAEENFSQNSLVKLALLLRKVVPKVLQKYAKVSDPYANLDAISGVVLAAAGFNYPSFFPVLFGLSRSVGMTLQILYERTVARNGRGTPIVRPKYFYRKQ